MYVHVLFNPFFGHSINIPVPYLSFESPQIKFENDKYKIDEAQDKNKSRIFFVRFPSFLCVIYVTSLENTYYNYN
jgi:hypothetical protein